MKHLFVFFALLLTWSGAQAQNEKQTPVTKLPGEENLSLRERAERDFLMPVRRKQVAAEPAKANAEDNTAAPESDATAHYAETADEAREASVPAHTTRSYEARHTELLAARRAAARREESRAEARATARAEARRAARHSSRSHSSSRSSKSKAHKLASHSSKASKSKSKAKSSSRAKAHKSTAKSKSSKAKASRNSSKKSSAKKSSNKKSSAKKSSSSHKSTKKSSPSKTKTKTKHRR